MVCPAFPSYLSLIDICLLCRARAKQLTFTWENSRMKPQSRGFANGFRNPSIWLILWGGASENVPGPRNRESPDVESPPSLPSLISSKIFSLLPDAVSLILFHFHCYAIVLTPEFGGALCKINHDDGDTYIKLTRWPVPCQTQFKLPLPIYQQSKPPLSGPC